MDQVIVSDSNRTPVVEIVTWLTLVASLLAFCTHAGIKFYATRSLGIETLLVFLSLFFSAAQSTAIFLQAVNGLGKPIDTLKNDEIEAMLASDYAATILFYCSLAFSKFAVVAFIHALTPKASDRYINYGLGVFSLLWMITSILVSAFQCPLPHPWMKSSDGCINLTAWWTATAIMNIASEVGLVALEIVVIVPLQMLLKRKVSILTLFICRLLVSISAAMQLYFFHLDNNGPHKNDLALGYWRSAILNQVVQCFAIVTTTLPYAKLFMESFNSGMMQVDMSRLKEGQSTTGASVCGKDYELLSSSRGSRVLSSQPGITRTKSFTVESTPTSQIREDPELRELQLRTDLV